jgi:hypothetical protein
MERGCARNRGCHSSSHLSLSRTHQDSIREVETYHVQTPPPTRDALKTLEEEACQARQDTPDSEIDVEMLAWIPDTGSLGSRETKYHQTIELYWHIKALLG